MPKEHAFLAMPEQKKVRPEIVYLPPVLELPRGLSLEYPRTILNNLLHQRSITILQAMLVEDDIKEKYQDHYDVDAVERGSLVEQAISDISRRIEKRGIGEKIRYERIFDRHSSRVEHDIRRSLKRGRSVIIGDDSHALLVAGSARQDRVVVIEPFPDILTLGILPERHLDLSPVIKAITDRRGRAYVLEK